LVSRQNREYLICLTQVGDSAFFLDFPPKRPAFRFRLFSFNKFQLLLFLFLGECFALTLFSSQSVILFYVRPRLKPNRTLLHSTISFARIKLSGITYYVLKLDLQDYIVVTDDVDSKLYFEPILENHVQCFFFIERCESKLSISLVVVVTFFFLRCNAIVAQALRMALSMPWISLSINAPRPAFHFQRFATALLLETKN